MRQAVHCLAVVLAFVASACTPADPRARVDAALEDEDDRAAVFEATLRALDANPPLADELFAQVLKHPRTLDRLLANAAAAVKDDRVARLTAWHLVQDPRLLQKMTVQVLDAAEYDRPARIAIGRGIEERARLAADLLTDRPPALHECVRGTIDGVLRKPESRQAFLTALDMRAASLADLMHRNPTTMHRLVQALLTGGDETTRKQLGEALRPKESPR